MSSTQLYSLTTEEGTFGFFREGYNQGYWVCTNGHRPGTSNIVCSSQKSLFLFAEAREGGASYKIFITPEKPKLINPGRGPSKKRSLGVKLFG